MAGVLSDDQIMLIVKEKMRCVAKLKDIAACDLSAKSADELARIEVDKIKATDRLNKIEAVLKHCYGG